MKGRVHLVEPFGTVDGPGIRMVVFLAGCPMGCYFCHNPDAAWGNGAELYSADELIALFAKNHCFYQSGGITFSGGEPLVQGAFVVECSRRMKENGVHIALDTSLCAGERWFDPLLKTIDLWMVGIKAIQHDLHVALTDRTNDAILQHVQYLDERTALLRIRYVIIPGVTAVKAELSALAEWLLSLSPRIELELLAYHTMGVAKWKEMGLSYKLEHVPDASKHDLLQAKDFLVEQGFPSARILG